MHEQWIQQIDGSSLTKPFTDAVKDFLIAFVTLPAKPNTINRSLKLRQICQGQIAV